MNKNKYFYLYSLLLFLWCLPFLFYQDFYRDDYTRLVSGYAGWENAGRPLATLLYNLLSMNIGTISNLYPLPMFLSILSLAYVFSKLHENIKRYHSAFSDWIITPAILLIVANPFFIQNLAYQYDVLPMCLALATSLLAFLILDNSKKNIAISVLLLVISLSFYQPASNIFVVITLFHLSVSLKPSPASLRSILSHFLVYITSLTVYYLLVFVVSPVKPIRSEKITLSELPKSLERNYDAFLSILNNLHLPLWLVLSCFLLISGWIISKAFTFYRQKRGLIFSSLVALSPFLILCFIWGPLLMLKETMSFPRTYMSVGMILCGMSLIATQKLRLLVIPTYLFIFSSAIVLNSFCFVQHQQFIFETKAIGDTVAEISKDKKLYSTLMIFSYGNMPLAKNTVFLREKIPYLNQIQKPAYRWETRFKMALLGFDYTNSMYTYKVADNGDEWNRICKESPDGIFSLQITTPYSDVYYDRNKKYTSIWFRDKNTSLCDKQPLEFDAE